MKPQTLKIGLAALALCVTGCGSSKFTSGVDTSSSTTLSSTSAAVTNCSHDISNQSNISSRLMVYSDANGSRADLIRVKFDRFPTTMSDADTNAIELWTRTIDSAGNWGTWHQVSFYVELYTSSAAVTRSTYLYNDLTWAQLKQFATNWGVSYTNSADLMGHLTLLAQLSDTTLSKTLTAKIYETSDSPEVTALIPSFQANPTTYAADHPSALYAYHPLQSMTGSNVSDQQYVYEASQFCF